MSSIPENLKYTKNHEWLRLEDNGTAVVGITDYAQSSLGDITFVELPEEDEHYSEGDTFGVVESVKAASDLYMPVEGKILSVNGGVANSPEQVNNDPYGEGWLIRIALGDAASTDNLLDAAAYREIVG